MTTVADTVKAALDAQWSGAGGTEPTYYVTEDIQMQPVIVADYILIKQETFTRDRTRLNDISVSETDKIDIEVGTRGDTNLEQRLDTLVAEVYRILTPTYLTAYHMVNIVRQTRMRSIKLKRYVATLTIEMRVLSKAR